MANARKAPSLSNPSLGDGALADEAQESIADEPMSLMDHLAELRTRLVRSLLGMIPGVTVAWMYRAELLEWLVAPMSKAWKQLGLGEPTIHFANPVDLFVAYMQIALVFGLLAASPWVFWQLWGFIAPGLYSREKRFAIPFVLASTLFFAGGALFGYSMVFPPAFEQFLGMAGALPANSIRVQPTIMIDEYMGFTTRLLLAFGLVFEVPVVVAFLAMAGIVNWKQLLMFGRWWILIASVIAALLTPPDVGSQMMMLVPLVVLYYLSVGVAYVLGPKPSPSTAAPEST